MILEKQVVSLELSKKMKELGFPQESLFYWVYTDAPLKDGSRNKILLGSDLGESHWELGGEQDTYSAYTVAELGEFLPEQIKINGWGYRKDELIDCQLEVTKIREDFWYVSYVERIQGIKLQDILKPGIRKSFGHLSTVILGRDANIEADARAKMLIYLAENNLISRLNKTL